MVRTHHCVGRANLKGSELTVLRGMQAESGQPSTGKLVKSTQWIRNCCGGGHVK